MGAAMRLLLGRERSPRHRLEVRWLWEPRDLWVGVFWNRVWTPERFLLVYVCLLPSLPICVSWRCRE